MLLAVARQIRALAFSRLRLLPVFKVGGQWRFKRDDIDAWIERQKLEAKGTK
ncbi:MAG: helix-turn-helix domain-containing protein [Myxococcales bacterium]